MLRPIDVSILDAKHLALSTARFQRTNDAIVHRRSCPLVFSTVHRQTRFQQRLLLLAMNPTIALGAQIPRGVRWRPSMIRELAGGLRPPAQALPPTSTQRVTDHRCYPSAGLGTSQPNGRRCNPSRAQVSGKQELGGFSLF